MESSVGHCKTELLVATEVICLAISSVEETIVYLIFKEYQFKDGVYLQVENTVAARTWQSWWGKVGKHGKWNRPSSDENLESFIMVDLAWERNPMTPLFCAKKRHPSPENYNSF